MLASISFTENRWSCGWPITSTLSPTYTNQGCLAAMSYWCWMFRQLCAKNTGV